MSLLFLIFFKAFSSSKVRLLEGGFACLRILETFERIVVTVAESRSCLKPVSTPAMISSLGMVFGAMAKLRPFCKTDVSEALNLVELSGV